MSRKLTESCVVALGEYVENKLGLNFPPSRHSDLLRGAEQAARELGFECMASFTEWLTSRAPSEDQLEILAGHLTVGETYFFREKNAFDILQLDLLPEFLRSLRAGKPSLRFWSAACCSGEEAYSIAMLLDSCVSEIQQWDISILATDLNPLFLEKARKGIYSEWSFRALPDHYRERYFVRSGENRFQISPHIQQMVDFRVFNLARDEYGGLLSRTGNMDMIFCRNVMIYFQPELCRRVISRLHGSLVPDGWLVVSPCEIPLVSPSLFETVQARQTSLFRKADRDQDNELGPASPALDVAASDAAALRQTPSADRPPPPMTEPEGLEESGSQVDPFAVAETLFERGLFAEAASSLEASHSDGLFDAQAPRGERCELTLLVRSHANLGRLPEALDWCAKAIAAGNTNPDFHYLHAAILLEVGRQDEAAEALRRVLCLDLDHVLAHFSLGNLCRQQARLEESNKHYRNALDLLRAHPPDEVIQESEGLTAGALSAMIKEMSG